MTSDKEMTIGHFMQLVRGHASPPTMCNDETLKPIVKLTEEG
jgi:hypothetical protein